MRKENYNQKYREGSGAWLGLTRFTTSPDNFSIDTAKLKHPFEGSDIAQQSPLLVLPLLTSKDCKITGREGDLDQEILSALDH